MANKNEWINEIIREMSRNSLSREVAYLWSPWNERVNECYEMRVVIVKMMNMACLKVKAISVVYIFVCRWNSTTYSVNLTRKYSVWTASGQWQTRYSCVTPCCYCGCSILLSFSLFLFFFFYSTFPPKSALTFPPWKQARSTWNSNTSTYGMVSVHGRLLSSIVWPTVKTSQLFEITLK